MDVYSNKTALKWALVVVALAIGGFSLYYNRLLSQQLIEREKRQVQLYAKGTQAALSENPSAALTFILDEVLEANESVPVILTDTSGALVNSRNLALPAELSKGERDARIREMIAEMEYEHEPFDIVYETGAQRVYYQDSELIAQLQYYPLVQLSVIAFFSLLVYLLFDTSRKAEQNRIWVGLAKETAHQLGTPISSLIAWLEYFRADGTVEEELVSEIEKDVQRLEMITARFSNIGSVPALQPVDVGETVDRVAGYLRKRVSTKVSINVTRKFGQELCAEINPPLFEWVIENICKNAVDAMSAQGIIEIYVREATKRGQIAIDISDNGKGIPKRKVKAVFRPGFTTKKRGWGLGLTLVKRIVENYHGGKIWVARSEVNIGTTFRIQIPKEQANKKKAARTAQITGQD